MTRTSYGEPARRDSWFFRFPNFSAISAQLCGSALSLPQVGVGFIDPVGARGMKMSNAEYRRSPRPSAACGRNRQHFARAHDDFFAIDTKLQSALQHAADLLVVWLCSGTKHPFFNRMRATMTFWRLRNGGRAAGSVLRFRLRSTRRGATRPLPLAFYLILGPRGVGRLRFPGRGFLVGRSFRFLLFHKSGSMKNITSALPRHSGAGTLKTFRFGQESFLTQHGSRSLHLDR